MSLFDGAPRNIEDIDEIFSIIYSDLTSFHPSSDHIRILMKNLKPLFDAELMVAIMRNQSSVISTGRHTGDEKVLALCEKLIGKNKSKSFEACRSEILKLTTPQRTIVESYINNIGLVKTAYCLPVKINGCVSVDNTVARQVDRYKKELIGHLIIFSNIAEKEFDTSFEYIDKHIEGLFLQPVHRKKYLQSLEHNCCHECPHQVAKSVCTRKCCGTEGGLGPLNKCAISLYNQVLGKGHQVYDAGTIKEKSFDATISRLLNILEAEFYTKAPIYVSLINPETQCFHYYGTAYYDQKIFNLQEDAKLIDRYVQEVTTAIKANPALSEYFDLDNNLTGRPIVDFLHLLTIVPMSRHYGITGSVYHARLPMFCHSEKRVKKSGIYKAIEGDPILGGYAEDINSIADTLEAVWWGPDNSGIKSFFMSPISLFGQIIGMAFVTMHNVNNPLTYYDYVRFEKILTEFATYELREAREYEFLSSVIKTLPQNHFDITKTVFSKLYVLFSISGACLKYDDITYRLVFKKLSESDFLPTWLVEQCEDPDYDRIVCGVSKADSETRCPKAGTPDILGIKSQFRMTLTPTAELILYFNFAEDLLRMHEEAIRREIEDAMQLAGIQKENIESLRALMHDTARFFGRLGVDEVNSSIYIHNRTQWMLEILGERDFQRKSYIDNMAEIESTAQTLSNDLANYYEKEAKIHLSVASQLSEGMKLYWSPIEAILLNLLANTYKNLSAGDMTVRLSLREDSSLFYMSYVQAGSFEFAPTPKEVQKWLNGGFNRENLKGYGHYIMQSTADLYGGTMCVRAGNQGGDAYTITKRKVEVAALQGGDTVLSYDFVGLKGIVEKKGDDD